MFSIYKSVWCVQQPTDLYTCPHRDTLNEYFINKKVKLELLIHKLQCVAS